MLGGFGGAIRAVLLTLLVGGAASAVVAPAFDMATQQRALSHGQAPLRNEHPQPTPQPSDDPNEPPKLDFATLLRMCLDTRDPDSDECAAAALESGLSYEEFRAKIVAKLAPAPTPKPEPVTKPEATKKPEPVTVKKPDPVVKKPEPQSDFTTWFEKCLATRDFNSDECIRAEELSGLGTADFEAKFNAKLAAKDAGDFWTWFEKCLASRDVRSDACLRAQQLIGFSDADFQAKFERYLAERDAKAGKATPKPTMTADKMSGGLTDALLATCAATRDWSSTACLEAFVRSGLQPAEFRAKMTAKFGAFN